MENNGEDIFKLIPQWGGAVLLLATLLSAGYLLSVDRILPSPEPEIDLLGKDSSPNRINDDLGGVPGEQVAISSSSSPVGLPYLLYLPPTWQPGAGHKWPILVFLHGQGESGFSPTDVALQGPPSLVKHNTSSLLGSEFAVLSPQKPPGSSWIEQGGLVVELVRKLVQSYDVDSARVYLTGVSAGGYGAWALAAQYPNTWAAVVPICGGGDPSWAPSLRSTPLWVFHGANDVVISVKQSDRMVKAVKEIGNENVTYTRLEDAPGHDPSWSEAGIPDMPGHASWVKAYYGKDGDILYRW
eukprot:CAMPEP_0196572820 /NCGR_PEP_ID=MMETSP1081-20130531/2805_1 /TAXON_ID=36882 /ORGANISM="Pyramimonas amylifera, Strain CCMP720" /LENGTH=297 /DNA_ID=CAMNT_0041890271 /DNA_START=122 /DNA_END=1012 /DNA_ORIENTATION=+